MARRPSSHLDLRLLLDEHLSPEIARQLRGRGHDVLAVGERHDLRGRPDRVHLASQPDQRRVIVTRDLGDFRPLLAGALRSGTRTYGLICVPRRFSLSRREIGRLVHALDALLRGSTEGVTSSGRGGTAPETHLMNSISEYFGSGHRSSATTFSSLSATSRTEAIAASCESRA